MKELQVWSPGNDPAVAEFAYDLKPEDREKLRWYYETYCVSPLPEDRKKARDIEVLMRETGEDR